MKKKIIVTGYVNDIRKEYISSCVNVAPMRFGAGTLYKIIESIAFGVPVVATSLAVQDLSKEIKDFVFIADSENEFVENVLSILNDPKKAREKVKVGRKVISDSLDLVNVVEKFENNLKTELEKLSTI